MRADWLPQVLRDAGLDVYVMPGAETRGRELAQILGVVGHHTASGPNWQDGHVAALLRDGRQDLAGPLAQLGLERDGTFVVVTTGKANHNGYGEWGNASIGIEAYNDGVGEPWPAAQIDAYQRGTAAILRHLNLPAGKFKGHRETDPKRKPDPRGIDLDAFRATVARLLAGAPVPPIIPTDEEDDMLWYFHVSKNLHYRVHGNTYTPLTVAELEHDKWKYGDLKIARLSDAEVKGAIGNKLNTQAANAANGAPVYK